ncbi:glucose-6-phosphate isomerase [Litorivivens sp.]|uniref:glucose-6-phosphate isomerase n=1 Tax=Litorivivens sp. TaxID=2020868 RepID=UPI00356324CF
MHCNEKRCWPMLEQLARTETQQALSGAYSLCATGQQGRFASAGGLLFDASKQRLSGSVWSTLVNLADESGLKERIADLFAGRYSNDTEQRWVRHPALRGHASSDDPAVGLVHECLGKMQRLTEALRGGRWQGATGRPISDVVNLGVGGSDLGPCLAVHALQNESTSSAVKVHFASSMDGSQLYRLLPELDPETTLFIISSKSFTTADTFACVETARAWMGEKLTEAQQLERHIIGVSACPEKMAAMGIPEEHQLLFWDWVGGRFSLWSVIGLPIALAIGMDGFRGLLDGARAMDEHFASAPFEENIPVLMALIGIWNHNFLGIQSHACLPYDGRLQLLPAYLQQLEMESNGKSATADGKRVGYRTAPVVWGGLGTNGQHAFFQLLHQGTEQVTADFIAVVKPRETSLGPAVRESLAKQQRLALANCFAQSRLLALGNMGGEESVEDWRFAYPGGMPSTTILLDELSPFNLGMLLAAYEHKVFAQGVIWGINSFDQPGVELGKQIAKSTLAALEGEPVNEEWDASTAALIAAARGERLDEGGAASESAA